MICCICYKEILGAYLQDEKGQCRHLSCKQETIFAKSTINVKPINVKSYQKTISNEDPDTIIAENTIGEIDAEN